MAYGESVHLGLAHAGYTAGPVCKVKLFGKGGIWEYRRGRLDDDEIPSLTNRPGESELVDEAKKG